MVSLASPSTAGGTRQDAGNGRASSVIAAVPFIRASSEHREPAGIDVTRQLTVSDQDLGVFDIPAYGYLRSVIIKVTATGGAGTGVTALEDAPWNVIKNIALTEPNGAQLSQFNSGYELYLANKLGGYRWAGAADPKASPSYTAPGATTGNFSFLLRIPMEIDGRSALGAIPNQNAAAGFKLRLSLAALAQVYGTIPTTAPSVRVEVFIEAWDQPENSTAGMQNAISPPAMNTTQFWSTQTFNVSAGQQNLRLTRTGNYIRNLVFILRRGSTSRVNGQADWPTLTSLLLDTRPLDIIDKTVWTNQMYERTGFGGAVGATVPAYDAPNGLDNGVFLYDFTHEFDQSLGRENRDLWLPTLGSTRLEIQGNFSQAGVLTVLTNDVAIAGNVFL